MFKNYLKIAWRNLIRGKAFSTINISGLAVGMAGAVLILLWLHNEISYDKFHKNKDRLYEVYGLTSVDGKLQTIKQTEQPLGPALKQDFPEAEATARMADINNFLFTAGDKRLTGTEGSFVDPSFLQMFSFPLIEGDKKNQLKDVYSIVITEKLAKKLFGNEDALNKTIKIDSSDNFVVTGVLKNLPPDTRFNFEYLLPWSYFNKLGWNVDSWTSNSITTFVLLKPNTDVAAFNNKIKDIAKRYAKQDNLWTHFLFPLAKWHLYSDFENGKPAGGRIETVRLFGAIAAFILLIACINFMNLSTARSEKRAKEVGIRKVAGAGKGLLIGQFITEAVLIAFIAGIIALLLVQLALSPFNTLINTQLSIPYFSFFFWLSALCFVLFTGFLAGSYPAFYLSAFNPVSIFNGKFKKINTPFSPRKVLVVLQFTFAVILIISAVVVRDQIIYVQHRETGYSKNNLIYTELSGDIKKNYPLIKQELINSGAAVSVTKTMSAITERGSNNWGLRWQGQDPGLKDNTIALFSADANIAATAGLQLIAGRDININRFPSDSFAVLLNETAVKTMGFKNPVGQIITEPANDKTWHVTGVVKDFIINSPYDKIPPLVIEGPGSWFKVMHVKLNPVHPIAESLVKAGQIFKKYNAAYPFDYRFADEEYAKKFDNEKRTKALAGLFATLAIFISCLGLFGLAAYMAESRIKEIGVRKVLGASVFSLWRLLSKEFVILVIISLLIAAPIAYYFMYNWLQNYQYRTEISWWIFAAAGFGSLVITLLTVSFQAIKAAIANPVKSLRTE